MKILVTGGAGFIGSHIADLLIENGHEVIVIDNLSSGNTKNVNIKCKFYHQDLSNFEEIRKIFEKEKPEIVYHLAAQIDIRKSVENPVEDARINVVNALNLLELCKEFKIKHFIFSSTGGAMYNDETPLPANEEQKEAPISPYGCAKLTIEKYLNFYNKVHNLHYTILRYSNVYGPRQNPKGEAGVISIFFDKMLQNQAPTIFGGPQTRDFVFVKDIAKANLLALSDKTSDFYNVGVSTEISIDELFNKINKIFNNKFKPEHKPTRDGEVKRGCLDSAKIKKALGWSPQYSLDKGIEDTYKFFAKK